MAVKTVFPITRLHQPLSVKLEIENHMVKNAWCTGILFRGFEIILKGRDPLDAPLLTQRICGICSSAHAIGAVLALEDAYQLSPTPNGKLLRDLIFGADLIHNHLTHFYLLNFPSYVKGPEISPFIPYPKDLRLPPEVNAKLLQHYWQGLEMAAAAHEMMAVFGGKAPHQQTIFPTGVSVIPDGMNISSFLSILKKLQSFIDNMMLSDAFTLGEYYPEYYQLGNAAGNFLSFGLFQKDHFFPGVIEKFGEREKLDIRQITESITHAWYGGKERVPPTEESTIPDKDKKEAYTWVKAPRYSGKPFESGPLARGWITGDHTEGWGTMDRIIARAKETQKIAHLMETWLNQLTPNVSSLKEFPIKASGLGVGLTDAMRGALGHWLTIKDGRIAQYQIITPTAWNFSPRDENNIRGPAEEALVGTVLDPKNEEVEIGRIIRSFDPCMTCAVH